MIRSLGIRIGSLVLALLMFGATARADQLTVGNFRLVIEDLTTKVERVITNTQTSGLMNINGDKSTKPGTITINADTTGAFTVTLNATSTTGPDGGAILTLSANVLFNSVATPSATHTLLIGLEDTGFTPPGGYPGSMVTFQQNSTGNLPSSASEIDFNSWIDVAGSMPSLGTNTGPTTLRALSFPVNAADPNNSQTFTTPGGSLTGAASSGNPVDLSSAQSPTGYSLYSNVVETFNGAGGSTNFTLTASDSAYQNSVPEPLSLVLLGSALLGYGVFRRKHQI